MEIRFIPNRLRDSWNYDTHYTSTICFFRGLDKDRKKKIDAHKSKVIEIFEKWNRDITIEPVRIFETSEFDLLGFHISIVSQLKSIDANGYALEHLKDSSYSVTLSLFNNIDEKESKHNTKVRDFYIKLSYILRKSIHEDIGLTNFTFQNHRLWNDENIDDTKKVFGLGFIDANEWLHTGNLLEYLLNRSMDNSLNQKDLVINEGTLPNGLAYHTLISRNFLTKKKTIAAASFDTKKLGLLKNILLSDEFLEISITLKGFDNEVKEIRRLYSTFTFEISKIVHDFSSLGLRGKCPVEYKLSFFSRHK